MQQGRVAGSGGIGRAAGGVGQRHGAGQGSSCRRDDGLLPTSQTESPLGVVESEAYPE